MSFLGLDWKPTDPWSWHRTSVLARVAPGFFLGESHSYGSVPWKLAWSSTWALKSLCKVEVDYPLETPLFPWGNGTLPSWVNLLWLSLSSFHKEQKPPFGIIIFITSIESSNSLGQRAIGRTDSTQRRSFCWLHWYLQRYDHWGSTCSGPQGLTTCGTAPRS